MSLVYLVYCNGCGVRSDTESYTGTRRARMYAARDGWTRPRRGRDLCPKCSQADREVRAKAATENGTAGYY